MVSDKQWSRKIINCWIGPYLIGVVRLALGTYLLDELDITKAKWGLCWDRLKKFFKREGIEPEVKDVDEEENNDDNTSEESVVEE